MDRVFAAGLLTSRELQMLGNRFERLWPIDAAPTFDDLLRAIDNADRELRYSPACSQLSGRSLA